MNVTDLFVMRNTLSLLAAHGTTFRNSYVSYPLCCPSRATFLTGQYAHNHGVLTGPALRRPRQHQHARRLAPARQVPDRDGRQVPERLRRHSRRPREIPPGWSRVVRAHRRDRAAPLRLQAQRERQGQPLRPQAAELHRLRPGLEGQRLAQAVDASAPSPSSSTTTRTTRTASPARPSGRRATPSRAPQYIGVFGNITAPRPPELRRGQRLRQAGGHSGHTAALRLRARRHRPALSRPAGEPALRRR